MPDSVVPDPEFQPRDDLLTRRIAREAEAHTSRADREAAALLAQAQPLDPTKTHEIVSLGWARGFLAGYETALTHVGDALTTVRGGDRK